MSTTPKNPNTRTSIYVLKDPTTLKIRYVGKTVSKLLTRLGQHISDARNNKINNHRVNWLRKLCNEGKLPIIEEIDYCTWEESKNLETYYIAYYKSLGCDLINETDGGEGTLGRKVSEATVNKLKNSLRNKAPKVYQYDLDGNFIKEWDNACEAAEYLNAKNASGITRCLRGDRYKYKNFIWKTEYIADPTLVCKDLKDSLSNRKDYKGTKGYNQCLLGKIISQEASIVPTPFIYVYSSAEHTLNTLLYEGISSNDVGSYINEQLKRPSVDISSRISTSIKNNKPYLGSYYFSNNPPENYKNLRHKALLIININGVEVFGVKAAADYLEVNSTNVINNLKGSTLCVNSKKFGKIKLTWRLNPENCRLYMKVYGLPTDELEEKAKKQLNIELTDSIAQGESVV